MIDPKDIPHRDSMVPSAEEDIMNRLEADRLIKHLDTTDSATVRLAHYLEQPDDYDGKWPPTFADVGRYIGQKFFGKVLSAMWVSRRVRKIERRLWNVVRRGMRLGRRGR